MSRPMSLRLTLIALTLLALTLPAVSIYAGGWGVVTLDDLPTQVIAGQPLAIGFVVRQHGQRPMEGLEPKIILHSPETKETLTLFAKPEGPTGHYAARLTFPEAGAWDWHIDAFGFAPQPMPRLNVLASAPASSAGDSAANPAMMVGGLSLLGAVGALVILVRTRSPWAAALMLAAALVSTVSLASAANNHAVRSAIPSSAETGRALFLAKGCIVCHNHAAVAEARKPFADFSIGPNLTRLQANPDFLQKWLRDPSAVKPGTQMPTLGLRDDEINALIAFLKTPGQ